MTNQPNPPATFASASPDAVPPVGDDQTFVRDPETRFYAPDGFATVVDLPPGVFAPLVVTQSVESALALAASGLLPGPARILAALTLESLAALRLPEPHGDDGAAVQQADGLTSERKGRALQPPRRVVFAPDGNPESLQAARQAARHARVAGWTVDGLPAPEGFRWTDVEAKRVPLPEDHLARIADLWVPPPADDPCRDAHRCEDPDEDHREAAAPLAPDL